MSIVNLLVYRNKKYFIYCLLSLMFLSFTMLMTLDYFTMLGILGMVGATSLVSSLSIIIITPDSFTGHPRHVFFGFLIAFIVGMSFFHLETWSAHWFTLKFTGDYQPIFGGLAVGVTFLLMLIFRVVHTSAVGFVVALVVQPWDNKTVIIVAVYVCIWTLISYFIRPKLRVLI